jgi:hypothetical protein
MKLVTKVTCALAEQANSYVQAGSRADIAQSLWDVTTRKTYTFLCCSRFMDRDQQKQSGGIKIIAQTTTINPISNGARTGKTHSIKNTILDELQAPHSNCQRKTFEIFERR